MTDYEIYSLQSYTDGIEEDLRPIKRAEFEDLNQEKISNYLINIKKDKPNLSKFSDEKILKLNGIIENSTGKIRPTLAGMMVFGEYPQGYLPQLFIACVVVPGRKLGDIGEMGQRFDDNKRVEGTIEEMLEESLSFVRKNIPARVIIDNNGKREDVPIYPMKALREAIANALIHRDYSSNTEGAYIYLRIFDDRIEILNPGVTLLQVNSLPNVSSTRLMSFFFMLICTRSTVPSSIYLLRFLYCTGFRSLGTLLSVFTSLIEPSSSQILAFRILSILK